MRRVAVTGIGVISPLGNSCKELINNLTCGRSGVQHLDHDEYKRLANRIAAPAVFDPTAVADAPKLRMMDRATQFALAAVRQAIVQAGLSLKDRESSRVGVFLGTGMGGAHTTDDGYRTLYGEQSDRVKPFSVLLAMNNAAAAWIGLEYGITGPNLTFSTACSSSAVAIGEAAMRIKSGLTDIMITGGTEAPLWLGPMKAWEALRTIASEDLADPSASCKPFSRNRSGMVLGEGSAILVLEEWGAAKSRGANILAEVIGYGLATDVAHLTQPSVDGQARAMQLALNSAEICATSIDYLNAHGTGTLANDSIESLAIKQVFTGHAMNMPVSSTKSMHGHLLGAASALEFVVSLLAMNASVIPPTANLTVPDPECDLDYVPNQARSNSQIRVIMSNSFAFGGTNAVLVARRMP